MENAILLSTDLIMRQIAAKRPDLSFKKEREWAEGQSGRIVVEGDPNTTINVGPDYVSVNWYRDSRNFIMNMVQPGVNDQLLADLDEAIAADVHAERLEDAASDVDFWPGE